MAVKNWLPCKRQGCSRNSSVKIFPEDVLGKFAKFGGDSFNRHEVIHLRSWRGPQIALPHPPPPGLNRVKLPNTTNWRRERRIHWRQLCKLNI